MSVTTELRDRVLRQLHVLAAGESPSAEDGALALDALATIHARLIARRLVPASGGWTLENVPEALRGAYARLAAAEAARSFGLDAAESRAVAAEGVEAEIEIRRQIAAPSDGEPVAVANI